MSPGTPDDRPPPPPGLVPLSASAPPSVSSSAPPPLAAGYTRSHGFVISPHVVAWLPAVFLIITLLSTFFPWVGTYVGGYPAVSQGPWRAMFGAVNRNIELTNVMKTPSGWLDKITSDWQLMVPCLILLLCSVALVIAERVFRTIDPRGIPPLAGIWPWRHGVLILLALLTFILLLLQVANGFGLERAIREVVSEQTRAERQANANKPSELERIEYDEQQLYAKFNMEHTIWLYLGVICNFLAILAMVGSVGLEKRGAKPPPRIVIQY